MLVLEPRTGRSAPGARFVAARKLGLETLPEAFDEAAGVVFGDLRVTDGLGGEVGGLLFGAGDGGLGFGLERVADDLAGEVCVVVAHDVSP